MNTASPILLSKRQHWGMEMWRYSLDGNKWGTEEEGRTYLKSRSLHVTPITSKLFLQEWVTDDYKQITVWGHTVSASCWNGLVCFKILCFQQEQLDLYLTYGFLWVQRKAGNRPESPFASNCPRTVTYTKRNQIYSHFCYGMLFIFWAKYCQKAGLLLAT